MIHIISSYLYKKDKYYRINNSRYNKISETIKQIGMLLALAIAVLAVPVMAQHTCSGGVDILEPVVGY
jgi:hypothetical protein